MGQIRAGSQVSRKSLHHHAELSPLVEMVRVFANGDESGYAPYVWHTTVVYPDPETAVIQGTRDAPTPDQWWAALEALERRGVKTVVYEHIVNGQMVTQTRTLKQG